MDDLVTCQGCLHVGGWWSWSPLSSPKRVSFLFYGLEISRVLRTLVFFPFLIVSDCMVNNGKKILISVLY